MTDSEPNGTELVFRKDGETLVIFAVLDGEQILHLEPTITRSTSAIKAAVTTFIGRAFETELDDSETEGAFQ